MVKIDNRLVFEDTGHKYFRVDEPDVVWTSGTTVVRQFSEPFRSEEWLDYKAVERLLGEEAFKALKEEANDRNETTGKMYFNYANIMAMGLTMVGYQEWDETRDIIQAEWSEEGRTSAERGTREHARLEDESFDRGREENLLTERMYIVPKRPKFEYDNEQLIENLYDLPDGYYPELIIWNDPAKICGQADGVFIRTEGSRRIATIRDYKFTKQKKMNDGSYCSIARQEIYMKDPISHIKCSKIGGYHVQMSLYGWMLAQFGFEIDGLYLDHYNEKMKRKIFHLDYLPEVGRLAETFL